MDQNDYDRRLHGFKIIDCVVRSRTLFYFTAVEDPDLGEDEEGPFWQSELKHRAILYSTNKPPEKQWGHVQYEGSEGLLAGAAKIPDDRFIGVDRRGQVAVVGGGTQMLESPIPMGPRGPGRGGVRRIKTIDGRVHICTGKRGLARRDGANQWTSLCADLEVVPNPDELEDLDPEAYDHAFERYLFQGFADFDAFNAAEYYCAGGKGDVWFFHASTGWQKVAFPDDKEPQTVCCAGDDLVYIGCEDGTLWRGRRHDWRFFGEKGNRFNRFPKFNDLVWFNDRVYGTSDHALWEIDAEGASECEIPEEVRRCCGSLSVGDGVLLMAGPYGAAYFNGQTWNVIFNVRDFASTRP